MTVPVTNRRWEYTASGSATTFPYDNKVFAASDLQVYVDGVLKTLGADYAVSGVGLVGGGNVTFTAAPAANASIIIVREVALTQTLDLVHLDDFPSADLEDALDKLTMADQQQQDSLDRAFLVPVAEAGQGPELPAKAARANKLLGFDANGDVAMVAATDDSATAATATGSTTSRTLAARFGDRINVLDWGVAPANGDTVNASALIALLAAAGEGKTIWFPDAYGTYQFASSSIAASAFTLAARTRLELGKATLQLTGSAECGFFRALDKSGIRVEGGKLVGNNVSSADGLAGAALYVECSAAAAADVEDIEIDGLELSGFKGGGWLRLQQAHATRRLAGVRITDLRASGGGDRGATSAAVPANQVYLVGAGAGGVRDVVIRGARLKAGAVKCGIALTGNTFDVAIVDALIQDAGQDTGAGVVNAYGLLAEGTGSGLQVRGARLINPYTGAFMTGQARAAIDGFYVEGQDEATDTSLARAGLAFSGHGLKLSDFHARTCDRGLAIQFEGTAPITVDGLVMEGNVQDDVKLRPSATASNRGGRIAGVVSDGTAAAGVRLATGSFDWAGLVLAGLYLPNASGVVMDQRYPEIEIGGYLRPKAGGVGIVGSATMPANWALADLTLDGAATTGATDYGVSIASTVQGRISRVRAINWSNGFAFNLPAARASLDLVEFISAANRVKSTGSEDLGLDTPTWAPTGEGTRVQKLDGLAVDGNNNVHGAWVYVDGAWRTELAPVVSAAGTVTAGTPLVTNPIAFSPVTVTQAHGLGAVPTFTRWELECLTAELGYSIGDKLLLPGTLPINVAGYFGYLLQVDATNLVLIRQAAGPALLLNKSTGAFSSATSANWKLTITPYKAA